jgi:predicted AAA+ superfamily ATPase
MIERAANLHLRAWLSRPRRKPLVLRGARQVGKTELVRGCARAAGRRLCEVNLERHPELERVFRTSDPGAILDEVAFVAGRRPNATDSILFLDEIQAAPSALPALPYLAEEFPDLPIVAAGSLLEFALREHRFSMPVGRIEYGFMGPLTFAEFLGALGETQLAELLSGWTWGQTFPESAHRRLLACLRQFLLVGGMPEAVAAFATGRDPADASAIHASILETYRDDFAKYAAAVRIPQVRRVFDHIPAHVGQKVKYTRIDPDARTAETRGALELLCEARVVFRVTHSDATGLPLGAAVRTRVFKTFFLDVGLVNHACGVRHLPVQALAQARFINEGAMAEQFVAQHLLFAGDFHSRPELFYWLREGRSGNAEVDFLTTAETTVVPVEVKAGAAGSLKSVLRFAAERGSRLALRLDANLPRRDLLRHRLGAGPGEAQEVETELLSLPLYLIGQAGRLVGVGPVGSGRPRLRGPRKERLQP